MALNNKTWYIEFKSRRETFICTSLHFVVLPVPQTSFPAVSSLPLWPLGGVLLLFSCSIGHTQPCLLPSGHNALITQSIGGHRYHTLFVCVIIQRQFIGTHKHALAIAQTCFGHHTNVLQPQKLPRVPKLLAFGKVWTCQHNTEHDLGLELRIWNAINAQTTRPCRRPSKAI